MKEASGGRIEQIRAKIAVLRADTPTTTEEPKGTRS